MDRQGDEIHLTQEEASGGSKSNIVRYVLGFSLVLAIVLLTAIWMFGAYRAPQGSHSDEISNQAKPTQPGG
jgi:flagellar biogenesis protein FliO